MLSSLPPSLHLSLADRHNTHLTVAPVGTRSYLARYWLLMSEWEGRAIPFDWTAGGSVCRPGSCLVCRSKRLRHTVCDCSQTHTVIALHHHQEEELSLEREDCRLPLQQGWLQKRKHSNMDTMKTTAARSDSWSQHERESCQGDALTGVGTWLWWPQDSGMASPRHYGHCARDIANVMQKLQGRCKMLTHSHCSHLGLQRF